MTITLLIDQMETNRPYITLFRRKGAVQSGPYILHVYFAGIKIFNSLPENIKKLSDNTNKFKRELKKYLLLGSFYSIEEFYGWTSNRNLYASYF
jgi:hypothetical protein